MSIAPIASSLPPQVQAPAKPVESGEATRGGKDVKNDGDADDAGGASKSAPASVTNTLGQQIGRHLSVKG